MPDAGSYKAETPYPQKASPPTTLYGMVLIVDQRYVKALFVHPIQ